MTTIKTNKCETLNLTKGESLRWYNTNAYGMTKKVVWNDENGGMWVRMSGKFIEVCYRRFGFYDDNIDENGVMPMWNRRFAYEVR